MELRHLRYLEAVAQEGTFVAAAAKLRLAQPALSRQIKDLEQELGVELLIREAGGSRLTVAGEAVVAIAQNVLVSVQGAIRRARLAEEGLVGKCVVGVADFPKPYELAARVIARMRNEFPGIEIVVDSRQPHELWDALANVDVDVALGAAPPQTRPEFAVQTFAHDVVSLAAVSAHHPLAQRESVRLEELASETFIGLSPDVGSEPWHMVLREFATRGFEPESTRNAAGYDGLRFLVAAGAGWTVLPRSFQSRPMNAALIPLSDFAVSYRYVIMNRRTESRAVVRCVLQMLRQEARADAQDEELPSVTLGGQSAPEPLGHASRVELRHLRYLVTTLHHESIGRAAEALGITQPALSRQLRDLEEEIGATLMTRTPRGVAPTGAGALLGRDAKRILAVVDRLGQEALRAMRGAEGRVHVGLATSPFLWELLTRAVRRSATLPKMPDIVVEEIATPRQIPMLLDARLDIALGHPYETSPDLEARLERVRLSDDAMDMALVPRDHPLAKARELTLADLADVPFLFPARDFFPPLYDAVFSIMARENFVPRVENTVDALPSIWALIGQGLGWGVGFRSQQSQPPRGTVAVPIRNFALPWGTQFMYRRGETRRVVLDVLNAIREAANEQ